MVTRVSQTLPSSRRRRLAGVELERCIYCQGKSIRREGRRVKKWEVVQLWYCRACDRVFTAQRVKGRTYPLKVVLEALMCYYRGESREQTSRRMRERFGIPVAPRTLSTWLAEYRELNTYARLRAQCSALYRPNRLIRSVRLHHQQVYEYRIHQGKLKTILATREHERFVPLAGFLSDMAVACPHRLFQSESRASQGKAPFDLDRVAIKSKRNHACRMAELVLQSVTHNKRRHDEVQRFMLATDSVTVAVEVPVYLQPEEILHFNEKLGFHVPIDTRVPLTGHIDVLQIRNGSVHIIDFKPGARHEKPITQLMTYALALSRRTGLKLFDFTCAWFDEQHYYEFYPLQVVHKRLRR